MFVWNDIMGSSVKLVYYQDQAQLPVKILCKHLARENKHFFFSAGGWFEALCPPPPPPPPPSAPTFEKCHFAIFVRNGMPVKNFAGTLNPAAYHIQ